MKFALPTGLFRGTWGRHFACLLNSSKLAVAVVFLLLESKAYAGEVCTSDQVYPGYTNMHGCLSDIDKAKNDKDTAGYAQGVEFIRMVRNVRCPTASSESYLSGLLATRQQA
ncbi:MAG: hypothetical protein HZB91_14740 [Elusimicrobia bacterium]|nr:hypothetical protein [Elusimicrobiota bacterium]